MGQNEEMRKGTAVTKPIELRPKKGGPSGSSTIDTGPPSDRRGTKATAAVSMIAGGRTRKASAHPDIVDQIGQRLRTIYNDVLVQPIPERFHELLRGLEEYPGDEDRPSARPARKSKGSK